MIRRIAVWVISFVLFCVVCVQCTRTAPEPPSANQGDSCTLQFPNMHVTYNNYVKKILVTYCVACHNGRGIAPGDFSTYRGVLPYKGMFYFRVLQDRADMPQGNAPLPKSIRDSLSVWIANCAPLQ
jgi:hypothetical protein